MTASNADAGALRDHYLDLRESSRRAEGVWYSGTLRDGLPVSALAFAPGVAARIQNPEAFFGALERAAGVRIDGVARPISWGRAGADGFHCAYVRDADVAGVSPGEKPAAEVAAVGVHLARALAGVHQEDLLHGAVSAVRIVRSGAGSVQLGAFGLFAALTAGGFETREAAALLSDIAYLSPEARVGTPLDPRSDVYALGACLYELITGKPPFGGRTTSYVMASVLSDQDDKPTAAEGQGSNPTVEAVLRAIERAPDDRWPSAAAFAGALAAGARLGEDETDETKRRSLLAIFKGAWFPARRSRE